MEERLDDAIHVLRTHAERLPPELYPGVAGPLPAVPPGYPSSNTSSIQSGVPVDQMVSLLVEQLVSIGSVFTSRLHENDRKKCIVSKKQPEVDR